MSQPVPNNMDFSSSESDLVAQDNFETGNFNSGSFYSGNFYSGNSYPGSFHSWSFNPDSFDSGHFDPGNCTYSVNPGQLDYNLRSQNLMPLGNSPLGNNVAAISSDSPALTTGSGHQDGVSRQTPFYGGSSQAANMFGNARAFSNNRHVSVSPNMNSHPVAMVPTAGSAAQVATLAGTRMPKPYSPSPNQHNQVARNQILRSIYAASPGQLTVDRQARAISLYNIAMCRDIIRFTEPVDSRLKMYLNCIDTPWPFESSLVKGVLGCLSRGQMPPYAAILAITVVSTGGEIEPNMQPARGDSQPFIKAVIRGICALVPNHDYAALCRATVSTVAQGRPPKIFLRENGADIAGPTALGRPYKLEDNGSVSCTHTHWSCKKRKQLHHELPGSLLGNSVFQSLIQPHHNIASAREALAASFFPDLRCVRNREQRSSIQREAALQQQSTAQQTRHLEQNRQAPQSQAKKQEQIQTPLPGSARKRSRQDASLSSEAESSVTKRVREDSAPAHSSTEEEGGREEDTEDQQSVESSESDKVDGAFYRELREFLAAYPPVLAQDEEPTALHVPAILLLPQPATSSAVPVEDAFKEHLRDQTPGNAMIGVADAFSPSELAEHQNEGQQEFRALAELVPRTLAGEELTTEDFAAYGYSASGMDKGTEQTWDEEWAEIYNMLE